MHRFTSVVHMEIEWKDPPAVQPWGRWQAHDKAFAEALKARPDEWAVYRRANDRSTAYVAASYIRTGRRTAFEKGAFEARIDKSTNEVFVRYVGQR